MLQQFGSHFLIQFYLPILIFFNTKSGLIKKLIDQLIECKQTIDCDTIARAIVPMFFVGGQRIGIYLGSRHINAN
ncbi:hypothetical protein BLOT_014816 [Blomia tropicalis]|nr:hypothetical protein BLOT_014816 [Blomia tropicalis]